MCIEHSNRSKTTKTIGLSNQSPQEDQLMVIQYILIHWELTCMDHAPGQALQWLEFFQRFLGEILRHFKSSFLLYWLGDRFFYIFLVGGWATPLKNMNVNWDDEIPNINGKIKNVPNHQPSLIVKKETTTHNFWLTSILRSILRQRKGSQLMFWCWSMYGDPEALPNFSGRPWF